MTNPLALVIDVRAPARPIERVPAPAGTSRYEVRGADGRLVAVHVRRDDGRGHKHGPWWEGPDGTRGLPSGLRLVDLPLFGTEKLAVWPMALSIVLTEGERAALALRSVRVPALGTVTGAGACPTPAALAACRGRRFVLWPDHDEAGEFHMDAIGAALWLAGAQAVYELRYRPTVAACRWLAGYDAADFVAGFRKQTARLARATVAALLEDWAVPVARPVRAAKSTSSRTPCARSREDGSVVAALADRFGLRAVAGQTARCPAHPDRRASLSVLRDDRRAICHAPLCAWARPGVTARDIRRATT